MLPIQASSLRASPHDSAPPPTSGGDPAGFASLLRQTQVANTPAVPAPPPPPAMQRPESVNRNEAKADTGTSATPEHTPADPSSCDAADAADVASANTAAAERSRALVKTRARASDGHVAARTPAAPGGDAKTATAPATDAKAADATAKTAAEPNAAMDPAVAQWLAAQQRPATAEHTAAGTGGNTTPALTTDAAGSAGGKRELQATDLKAQAEVNAKAGRGGDLFKAEFNPVGTSAALAEQRVAEPLPAPADHGVKALDAAGAAALNPPSASVREATAPVAVAVATPVNAPDFAQALGMQLSVLARDGVQQAELHLNPADMGPVSVQIVMDGTQARVDFGADVAATRQAIEAGLPELASALRDAGFTLAGGGVSQHSSSRSDSSGAGGNDGQGGRREARRVSDAGAARVGAAARRVVTAGGLDLYA